MMIIIDGKQTKLTKHLKERIENYWALITLYLMRMTFAA